MSFRHLNRGCFILVPVKGFDPHPSTPPEIPIKFDRKDKLLLGDGLSDFTLLSAIGAKIVCQAGACAPSAPTALTENRNSA
jgi:hypothetical protein